MQKEFGRHPIYEVFQNAQFGPMKSDIWRYCILYRRGGVYCDIGKSMPVPIRREVTAHATAGIAGEPPG